MEVSSFFTRLLQTTKEPARTAQPDDVSNFDAAWQAILETLEHPDERQLLRGISVTDVPARLRHIVDALVYEGNRSDEDTTGACLEYFLRNDLLSQLGRLCEADQPHGIKTEVVRAVNNLVVLLPERFLVHNAVHRPLRRLLRSCVGDDPNNPTKIEHVEDVFGAAAMAESRDNSAEVEALEEDLVDLMCILCSRMKAYPNLLLIFFRDRTAHRPLSSEPAPDIPLAPVTSAVSSSQASTSDPSRCSTEDQQGFEFLLFSYLLRFIHREGRIGDFARAGLLSLFNVAFIPPVVESGHELPIISDKDAYAPLQEARAALARYILGSDFADVMAAGLGAVFSLLPSKLYVPTLADQAHQDSGMTASQSGGMRVGESVDAEQISIKGDLPHEFLKSSVDMDTRAQLDLLLKLLTFAQDTLHRCREHPAPHNLNSETGRSVTLAVVQAVRASFLDNVLYPSILESSSTDGSAVAVMTYLDVIFSFLDEGPLLRCMLEYLMATDYSDEEFTSVRQNEPSKRMSFSTNDQTRAFKHLADLGRFSLKDLILDMLRSRSSQARTTSLCLMKTILDDHCERAATFALDSRNFVGTSTYEDDEDDLDVGYTGNPIAKHLPDERLSDQIGLYGALISRIDPLQTPAEVAGGYTGYLSDIHTALQCNPCFQIHGDNRSSLVDAGTGKLGKGLKRDSVIARHRLSPRDPLLRVIFDSLGQFLCRTPDENIALTGVLTGLAMCPKRSLNGWLANDPEDNAVSWLLTRETADLGDSTSDDSLGETHAAPVAALSVRSSGRIKIALPAVYQIIHELVKQVHRFRLDVDDFDRLLSERRQGLLFADHLDETMNAMLDVEPSIVGLPPTPKMPSSPSKRSNPGVVGNLMSLFTPRRRSIPASPTSPTASTPVRMRDAARNVSSSTFKTHYNQTAGVTMEARPSSPISSGPWSPAKLSRPPSRARPSSALSQSVADSASLTSREGKTSAKVEEGEVKQVSLSMVLDNCVILEEFLKEIVSVIMARRALGIDQVDFT